MVQILKRGPSFGEQLAQGLGQGFGRGVDTASQFAMQMGLQKQKDQAKHGFYQDLLGMNKGSQQEGGGLGFQPLSPQQKIALALENPPAFNAYQSLEAFHEKKEGEVKQKTNLESTLKEMTDTLLEGRLGYTHKRFGKKGRRDVQYFDTLGTQLESIGKEMVSKGVLSAPRFAYLLSNLPSAKKTDASNAGAIEAWAKELNLDVPEIDRLKTLYESPSESKKVKPGTPLDLETMEKIYKKTGGDKAKSKAVAKKMGYEVE